MLEYHWLEPREQNEILSKIQAFLYKKMHLKMPSGKWRPFCLGRSVLRLDMIITWVSVALTYGQYHHYKDVIMSAMASQISSLTIIYSTVYSGVDHRKHQSSASLAFVRGIHRWPVIFPHKGPATRKLFPALDDVIIKSTAGCLLITISKTKA